MPPHRHHHPPDRYHCCTCPPCPQSRPLHQRQKSLRTNLCASMAVVVAVLSAPRICRDGADTTVPRAVAAMEEAAGAAGVARVLLRQIWTRAWHGSCLGCRGNGCVCLVACSLCVSPADLGNQRAAPLELFLLFASERYIIIKYIKIRQILSKKEKDA